jgi:hypothetical protein
MRLKVIIPIVLITLALLVVIQLAFRGPNKDTTLQDFGKTLATNAVTEGNSDVNGVDAKKPLQAGQVAQSSGEESHEEYISRRTAELMDLAMSDDPGSLHSILSELNNSEAEIRDAAVMAAVQFKSAEAIPALQDAYTRTDEPEEKISIRKAIEFLEPTPASGSATSAR